MDHASCHLSSIPFQWPCRGLFQCFVDFLFFLYLPAEGHPYCLEVWRLLTKFMNWKSLDEESSGAASSRFGIAFSTAYINPRRVQFS